MDTPTLKPIRVAVIGAGAIARYAHVPHSQAVPGVEVVAICDVNEARAQELAQEFQVPYTFTSGDELLQKLGPDLDAVTICTPNVYHAPMTIAALQAGLHVMCEKPMATNSADASAMLAAAQQYNRILTIGTHYRYRGPIVALRKLVAAGQLGDIYYAKASWTRRSGIPGFGSWFTNRDLAGAGVIYDLGVHVIDLALHVMGYPRPVSVKGITYDAMGRRGRGLGGWGADISQTGGRFDVDDLASAMIHFDNGATLIVDASWAGYSPNDDYLYFLGTEGGAHLVDSGHRDNAQFRLFIDLPSGPAEVRPEFRVSPGTYGELFRDFYHAIRTDSPPPVDPAELLVTTQILDAVLQSARSGREVIFNPAGSA
jgi:predicted dehydrogenase